MTTPRVDPKQELLRQQLLGNQDNSTLKSKFSFLDSQADRVRSACQGAGIAEASFKPALDALSIGEPYSKKAEGSIISLIRKDINDCILSGAIKNSEDGEKRIEAYKVIVLKNFNNFLNKTDLKPEDFFNKAEIENEIKMKRNELNGITATETKEEQATVDIPEIQPKRSYPNLKDQAANMDDYIVNESDLKTIFGQSQDTQLRDSIQDQFSVYNPTKNTSQYNADGDIITIIKNDIQECRDKGYIKTKTQESLHIQEYMNAIQKNLNNIVKEVKSSSADPANFGNIIKGKLTGLVNDKKHELREEIKKAQSEEEKIMSAHIKKGEEFTKENLENAKQKYKEIYTGIATAQKRFISTRRFFNSSLKQQEQLMIQLGASKKDIQTFKKGLQSELLPIRASVSKTATPGQSSDNALETPRKSVK